MRLVYHYDEFIKDIVRTMLPRHKKSNGSEYPGSAQRYECSGNVPCFDRRPRTAVKDDLTKKNVWFWRMFCIGCPRCRIRTQTWTRMQMHFWLWAATQISHSLFLWCLPVIKSTLTPTFPLLFLRVLICVFFYFKLIFFFFLLSLRQGRRVEMWPSLSKQR